MSAPLPWSRVISIGRQLSNAAAQPDWAPQPDGLSPRDQALASLLGLLAARGYRFTTPAPTTLQRVRLRRRGADAAGLEDVFGWNLPFSRGAFGPEIEAAMAAGGVLRDVRGRLASAVRVAAVGDQLFLHSAVPPAERDPVFFGPDSYRFVEFIRAETEGKVAAGSILDIGAGAGVGGLFAAGRTPRARLTLADTNPDALRFARINAAFVGVPARLCECDGVPADGGAFDLIVTNPPYIDASGRTYSDGGGGRGSALTVAWTRAALRRLAPGGRLLVYSGSAIVGGRDSLREALCDAAAAAGCSFSYRELDPDVWPATLLNRRYWAVERIAAIGAAMTRPRG